MIKEINKKLMANFVGYTRSQSPCTSHTDFLHQQLPLSFLFPTPNVIGGPSEFLGANIKCAASWSEAEDQLSSFSR